MAHSARPIQWHNAGASSTISIIMMAVYTRHGRHTGMRRAMAYITLLSIITARSVTARLAQWHDAGVGFFNIFYNHEGCHTRHGLHSGTADTYWHGSGYHCSAQCQLKQSQLSDIYSGGQRGDVCIDADYVYWYDAMDTSSSNDQQQQKGAISANVLVPDANITWRAHVNRLACSSLCACHCSLCLPSLLAALTYFNVCMHMADADSG